jgi:diguanylate cyclase (GGDEF)-like protein/PAS domain S-box-containing protein
MSVSIDAAGSAEAAAEQPIEAAGVGTLLTAPGDTIDQGLSRDRRFAEVQVAADRIELPGSNPDVTDQQCSEQAHRNAHELFETAFSQAPIGMALVALDGRWLRVNSAVTRITGWAQEELLAGTFQDITHPDDLEADLAQIERLVAGEIPGYQMEKRYLTKGGEEIWVNLSVSLVRDQQGTPKHFISQIEDISQRKHAQARLQQAEFDARTQRDHARAIISAMHDGYALTVGGELKVVNEALCELTGFSEDELVGARVPFPFWPPERLDETMALRRRILAQQGGSFEVTLMRSTGERFEAEITAKPARDADGNVFGFVNTLRDVGVQRRQQRELERLARTDALTGLANRHVLQAALDRAAQDAHRQGHRLALVLLDIDWFKQVNDAHGHPAGDATLVEVAQRLTATVRTGEVLARVGGEEFAWLLPEAGLSDAMLAADRARIAISAVPFATAGRLTMSAGVGVMHAPADGDALYRLADRALYEAKQGGRDRTSCLTLGLGADATPEPPAAGAGG